MGMYDTVGFSCPSCGEYIEEQSKAGQCTLRGYDSDRVPTEIAQDIVGEMVYCEHCDKSWEIVDRQPTTTVRMSLIPA